MFDLIESNLYIDNQAAIPAGRCERCGGALYFPSCICIRCEEAAP